MSSMNKKISTVLLLLLSFAGLQAQTLQGTVLEAGSEAPVAFALVVALETEDLTETAEDGRFLLEGSFQPPFTLRVLSDQHATFDLVVENWPETELVIILTPLAVDMGAIEALAQRSAVKTSGSVDARQIRTTATGNDPFALVDRLPDVINPSQPALDNDFTAARMQLENALGSPVFSLINPFHYRGLPYYANAYFLNMRMPLFFQYYSFTGAMLNSTVPSNALAGMDMYGNGREPALGPGAGLLSSMRFRAPRATLDQEIYLTTLAAGYVLDWGAADEQTGLMLSVRKSLFEFTWIPIVVALNSKYQWYLPFMDNSRMLGFILHPGTIDAQLHFYHVLNDRHTLSLDFVNASGYTDFGFELLVDNPLQPQAAPHFMDVTFQHLNQQTGLDLIWEYTPDLDTLWRFSVYDMLGWTGRKFTDTWLGGEEQAISYDYPLNDLGAVVDFAWTGQLLKAAAGLSGRYLYGWYTRNSESHPDMGRTVGADIPPTLGLQTGEVSAWIKGGFVLPNFELEAAVRGDWFESIESSSFIDQLRFSPSLHLYYFPWDRHSLHFGTALRYDRFDYITRHMFISQQGIELATGDDEEGIPETIDERYVQEKPARVVSAELEYSYEADALVVRAAGYGLYGDELSGFDFQSFYVSTDGQVDTINGDIFNGSVSGGDAGFKEALKLWSAGTSLTLLLQEENRGLDIVYSWGMSRYYVIKKSDTPPVWVIPNSDTTHTIKLYGNYTSRNLWDFGSTLRVHVGVPQTPNRVDEVFTEWDGSLVTVFSPVPDSVNKLRDYMPRFAWDFKITKRFVQPHYDWELYLDVANVFSFPRYKGPKAKVKDFVEAKTADRSYDWTPVSWTDFPNMRIDLGLRFRF